MIRWLLKSQAGVTLIELIVAMIVISIALGGVLMVMNYTTSHSADPMLRHQAIAIAEAYMEEITLKAYLDPDDSALCPANEGSRALFDNVCDYAGHSDADAVGQVGATISNYAVDVAVTATPALFGSPGIDGLKIDVTVTDPAGETLTLTGYRADY